MIETKEYPNASFRLTAEQVAAMASLRGDGRPWSSTAKEFIEYARIAREEARRSELDALFTATELLAICGALNGTMFSPETVKYVATEIEDGWSCELDVLSVVTRVRGLSAAAKWALIDSVGLWWKIEGRGEDAETLAGVGLVPAEGI